MIDQKHPEDPAEGSRATIERELARQDDKGQTGLDRARESVEGRTDATQERAGGQRPAAGPHATEAETNDDATPGSGALPDRQPRNDMDGATS